MRATIENALVDAEVIRQNMLADFMVSMAQIAPSLAAAAATMSQGAKEAFFARSIASIAADVLSDHGGALEDNAELTVESITKAVLGNGG